MAKTKMKLVNIVGYMDEVNRVLERLVSFPCIELVDADKIIQTVHGSKPHSSLDVASPLLAEINAIEKEANQLFSGSSIEGVHDNLDQINREVKEVHQRLQDYNDQTRMLEGLLQRYSNALTQVQYLETLNISLDDIFECEYVNARVGVLPIDSIEKLSYYYNTPFIFKSFAEENGQSWCMYFSTRGFERAVDNIFSSLLFERIFIPDFVHGTPQEAKEVLKKEMNVTETEMNKVTKLRSHYLAKHQEVVQVMRSELELLQKIHQAEKYVIGLGSRFSIMGFIEEKTEETFLSLFKKMKNVEVEIRPADSDKRLKAPKKITNKLCQKK